MPVSHSMLQIANYADSFYLKPELKAYFDGLHLCDLTYNLSIDTCITDYLDLWFNHIFIAYFHLYYILSLLICLIVVTLSVLENVNYMFVRYSSSSTRNKVMRLCLGYSNFSREML